MNNKTLGEFAMDGWCACDGTGPEKWQSAAEAVKAEVLRRHDAAVTKAAERRRYALLQAAATITAPSWRALDHDPYNGYFRVNEDEAIGKADALLAEIERREPPR